MATNGDPAAESADRTSYECSGWSARFSPSEKALLVTGSCTMPTPGYELSLSANVNQGTNPRDALRVAIVAKPPDGIVPQVVTETPVRYEHDVGDDTRPWPRVVVVNASPPASIDVEEEVA